MTILVVAAVLWRDGRLFLARRAAHKNMGGKWEFPGGKVESRETPEAALERELHEELGIATQTGQFLCQSDFWHQGRKYRLLAYETTLLSGQPCLSSDHDAMAWVLPSELPEYDLSPADDELALFLRTSTPRTDIA